MFLFLHCYCGCVLSQIILDLQSQKSHPKAQQCWADLFWDILFSSLLEDDQQPDSQSYFGSEVPKCFDFLGSVLMFSLSLQNIYSREGVEKIFLWQIAALLCANYLQPSTFQHDLGGVLEGIFVCKCEIFLTTQFCGICALTARPGSSYMVGGDPSLGLCRWSDKYYSLHLKKRNWSVGELSCQGVHIDSYKGQAACVMSLWLSTVKWSEILLLLSQIWALFEGMYLLPASCSLHVAFCMQSFHWVFHIIDIYCLYFTLCGLSLCNTWLTAGILSLFFLVALIKVSFYSTSRLFDRMDCSVQE